MNANTFNFLNDLDISKDVKQRISHLLSGVVSGQDAVIQTPLGEHAPPEQLLDEWNSIYEANISKCNETLQKLEDSQKSKFGPRSIAIPWEDRRELVLEYFGPDLSNNEPTYAGPASTRRLRPLSLANAMSYLKNDTNSGLPFYVRKSKVKEEVLANFNELLKRRDPCIMFTRTQEGKKTRAVWGFPIADTLNEMRYYRPVLDYQRTQPWRAAVVNPEEVDDQITQLIHHAMNNGLKLVSIDFSSYDMTVRKSLQKLSFQYIKDLFQGCCEDDLNYIAERFSTIGLVTPDGVLEGEHGVPSGSTFTNEVDSIAQYICAKSIPLELDKFQIQGDDGAYATSDPEALKQGFKNFGLNVNDEKSYVADDYLIYLQMLHHKDYEKDGIIGGIYPTFRALNRLIYQERFDNFKEYDMKGSDYYAIRTISILENCRNHPLFEEFVKFIYSKDKYGLSPSQQGIDQYVKMLKDKAGIEGIFYHQYGEKLTGIAQFETVKLISKL